MATSTRSAARAGLRLRAVGQFVRLSALGVTVFFPLLGVASSRAGVPPRWPPLLAILIVAVLFHVFAYVSNDVVDLPIDRTAPGRASSPLVRGAIRPGPALALALAQVPLIVLVAWRSAAGVPGIGVMLAACCLMASYNLWGKRARLPPLTDLVQGLGWAALTLYGAMVGGGWSAVTGWVLAFVVAYIVMANGIHGSIRDLRNDHRHGVRSTAILLGARPGPGTAIVLPGAVTAYVLALQALLAGLALAPLLRNDPGYAPVARALTLALVIGLAVVCQLLLARALRAARDERSLRPAGILHLLATLALPIALLAGRLRSWMLIALLAGYLVPFLLNGWLREALQRDR
jgi:4-hydroxybenzoate polyprenyltransferase